MVALLPRHLCKQYPKYPEVKNAPLGHDYILLAHTVPKIPSVGPLASKISQSTLTPYSPPPNSVTAFHLHLLIASPRLKPV